MNKVMLIGNVGKEPDVKYYDADQAVAQFPLATTERGYVLQNGTRVPDRTDWHNIVMWGNLAKIAEKYVHKGDKLYIEGRIRYRYYDDKKGQRRFVTEIYADNMELLTSRQAQQQQPAVAEAEQPKPAPASASINKNNNDDTLPF
ncbi:single-stranded DNA-binding protein [uncultured Prevotella sp.]|uniref:single-stranded DNA-binding protein n=1 Tax=uncultured Prevotella sp. TaxID=159272 RepID=UPI0027E2F359|nr:single-stranded DNA-binding protein [uncultured Prevotella sp.]